MTTDITIIKGKFKLLHSVMDERLRRLWAATEAQALGHGGITLVAKATGLSSGCIRTGICELEKMAKAPEESNSSTTAPPQQSVRQAGGGRKLIEVKDPTIEASLEQLLANETAGDPMSEQRWIRSSTRDLSKRLKETGHQASSSTVSRLLKKMGFSMKANKKRMFHVDCPDRDEQFRYIAGQRETFSNAGLPIISVDTKKKELIGDFGNSGRTWCKQADEVNEHDFPSAAAYKTVPYGVYDVTQNTGYVFVGISADTPEFAADNIAMWWRIAGQAMYPKADQLLILADGGGSNSCKSRAWKLNLQNKLSSQFGLILTVCHYPTGCSKWNPIEHRLFSFISINWAGKPLRTLETMLGYLRGTNTTTGLKVEAYLQKGIYKNGQRVSKEKMDELNLQTHSVCPKWNYTIRP